MAVCGVLEKSTILNVQRRDGRWQRAGRDDVSRELDTQVAQTVFALNKRLFCTQNPDCYHAPDPELAGTIQMWKRCGQHDRRIIAVPQYSTDIAAAWSVVELMNEKHVLPLTLHTYPDGWSWASFTWRPRLTLEEFCREKTAPLAICRAALMTVGSAQGETTNE